HQRVESCTEPIYYPIRRSDHRLPMRPGSYTEIRTGSRKSECGTDSQTPLLVSRHSRPANPGEPNQPTSQLANHTTESVIPAPIRNLCSVPPLHPIHRQVVGADQFRAEFTQRDAAGVAIDFAAAAVVICRCQMKPFDFLVAAIADEIAEVDKGTGALKLERLDQGFG